MAPRKLKAPSPATAAPAKEIRDERARRTNVIRDPSSLDRLTELNSVNSPLLRLPAELRTMIFTYVFSSHEYFFDAGSTRPIICAGSLKRNNMGLLLVSRQLYAETALLPYQLGTICFHFHPGYGHMHWLSHIGEFIEKRSLQQIQAIVSLKACLHNWSGLWKILDGPGIYWAKQM